MALQEKIDQDIKAAMLAKDNAKLRGLRAIKAALLVAKTEKNAAETLSEDTEIKVLQRLVKQRRESADIYKQQHRDDLFQIENEEIEVIESYLPK
ncbi:MAG TPA: GatB/YqeY domain-containing protein, partial [Sphingobacteriaceae bacterium]|nr:GatB/YqeY domain-containing protein [Sphingobacteriaceae bacterium]